MKIQKFNESVQNWTEDKIQKMYDDKFELGCIVLEYLEIYHKDLFKDEKQYYFLEQFWFEEDEEGLFNVYCKNSGYRKKDDRISYEFSTEEFQDLLSFMNNPETYRDSKKYNI